MINNSIIYPKAFYGSNNNRGQKLKQILPDPVTTDTEGAIESVRFNGVSVLSGSCYLSKKDAPYYEKKIKNKRGH